MIKAVMQAKLNALSIDNRRLTDQVHTLQGQLRELQNSLPAAAVTIPVVGKVSEVPLTTDLVQLNRVASVTLRPDSDLPWKYHVISRFIDKRKGEFGHSYYIDQEHLNMMTGPHLMEFLHKRFVSNLQAFVEEERS